ncbi:uncharacterized protein N7483_011380 [Penicillium malachiteum]|uniref:uncharacterized protein n=1 Tax=Penicillium malachiteum TaxID=1324776 RepID=UPI0025489795|nr:uncharacterized protein N7483_011380 [Penicillium malachiteum]KAJ5714199.1 hypothetical protein N7483_011380 [Penicillium malachiteum]
MATPTTLQSGLRLSDAKLLLENPYLPMEAGVAVTEDGHHHIAASTYMKASTGAMIDWWFGWIHNTEQYKLWHPRDHVFSDWEDPATTAAPISVVTILFTNTLGRTLPNSRFHFATRTDFQTAGYSTAICGKVGNWNDTTGEVVYGGHLIHLIKVEPDGIRMRSRFWLGDIPGLSAEERKAALPREFPFALMQHAAEEMAILSTILPDMYEQHAPKSGSNKL